MHTIKKFFKIWLVMATVLAAIGVSSYSCWYVSNRYGDNVGVALMLVECSILGAAFCTALNHYDNKNKS